MDPNDAPTTLAHGAGRELMVARAVAEHLDPATADRAARAAADALLACWPQPERAADTALAAALRANTLVLREARNDALWTPAEGGHPVLFRVARSLGGAGLLAAATAITGQLVESAHTRLGSDHPETLTTRHNLARWRGEAADPAGAATAFAQLLDDYLRVLGPDHPETLTTRRNLAYWRSQAAASAS